jgi:uncharacterized protein YbjT (DUF2867 family)
MKIAILGATGRTGNELVKQCLEKDYSLNILTRALPPKGVPIDARITIVQGSSLEKDKLVELFGGCKVVIVTLGGSKDVCSKSQPLINDAARSAGVERIIVITSLGCGESYNDASFVTKAVVYLISKVIADKNVQEKTLSESGLDYTIVRPGGLNNQPTSGVYRFSEKGISGGSVSRGDVAHFIVNKILPSPKEFSKKAFSVVQ